VGSGEGPGEGPVKSALTRAIVLAVVLGVAWYLRQQGQTVDAPPAGAEIQAEADASPAETTRQPEEGFDAARQAFERKAGGQMLRTEGRVERILADDNDGSPHQRFIIVTDSGLSLLIAHNIELAPRLDGLAAGDRVSVFGEYEWNDKGGLIHWTHDDPGGNHQAGYIEWHGRRYQ
jgi:hypothetical protein